jgi:hypothetical protein
MASRELDGELDILPHKSRASAERPDSMRRLQYFSTTGEDSSGLTSIPEERSAASNHLPINGL